MNSELKKDDKSEKHLRVESKASKISKTASHFLVPPETLDKVTRHVVAPYAQIERKGFKDEEAKEETYIDLNRFKVFLKDEVDLNSLLYETAVVLKSVTSSSGVFVYIVNNTKNEIVLMPRNMTNPERHEVNIPISTGKMVAAHVAATKEYLMLSDVERDTRFSEGLRWVDAKSALSMPVVKPDGECYAVVELYRNYSEPYDNACLYSVVCCAGWAGAAVHQTQQRITLQKKAHLNGELLLLMQQYFSDRVTLDTMITEMLTVVKAYMCALRSSFYLIDQEHLGDNLVADMWDDGFASENTSIPKKKFKINLSLEQSPAGLVARTGKPLNVPDVYLDPRFTREVDPTTGSVVRTLLASPILDKSGVIGVVQLINKIGSSPFNAEDEEIFGVFVSYCSLIVHFSRMQHNMIFNRNLNNVQSELMSIHLAPCRHDLDEMMETDGVILPPADFKSFDFYITDGIREEMPRMLSYMFSETMSDRNYERRNMADFILTVLSCYRDNPYHNSEHAFVFTHTMYNILITNTEFFDFIETAALMLAGLCHDLDHPGYNNNFLALCKHPLALMYRTSTLENHHYYFAKKLIEDKNILSKLSEWDRDKVMSEIKYNILCTDLAVYFQLRARLTPIVVEQAFNWSDTAHKKMLKGIMMTTCDLSATCKPFVYAKQTAVCVYEEFYNQGDREREMGYTPLSMMDRKRSSNQPAEQIQFLSVVVLPCLLLLQNIFPSTSNLIDNCRKTQEAWHEEIELRGQRLWKHESIAAGKSRHNIRSHKSEQEI